MTEITIDRRRAVEGATLHVRLTGRTRMRLCTCAAVLLIRLASAVLGPKATIDIELQSGR